MGRVTRPLFLVDRLHSISHVHGVARRVPIRRILESNIQIGRGIEHVHQRPQSKATRSVPLEAKIDPHVLDTRGECLRGNSGQVVSAEIAAQLVVQVH